MRTTHDIERVSELIGDIYDAALDPSLWVGVLEKAGRFVGGGAATLYSKDVASRTGKEFYQYGVDPHYVQLYFEKYIKFDPSTTAQLLARVGDVVSTTDYLPYDDFLQTRFYREWAHPQRWVDGATSVLEKSASAVAMFSVFRHKRDGLVDDEMRRRMQLMAPHIRRAVLVGKLIDHKTEEAATFADTLDGLSAGMFLVDASGRIVHANAAGHAILTAEDFLRAPGGRLVARDRQADQSFRDIFAAAGNGDMAIGIKGIALPLMARDGERYVGHVLPLTSGARRRVGAARAAAALFVHKAALETPSPPEAIARTYKLTPTELRVLVAIVEVGGVPEVAETLGIADTTVKIHLSRLFEKTDTRRQADLVKLVAGFCHPLLG